MSDQEVPGEGYEFPEWSSPESPRVERFPQKYGWPRRPIDVHGKKRSIALERWMSSRFDLRPNHTPFCDFWDSKRSTESVNGFIELKSPSVYTTDKRVGRFNLTTCQYRVADWIGLTILRRDEWDVLACGMYPMKVLDKVTERRWHKINRRTDGWTISWKSVLEEVDRADFSDNSLVVDKRDRIDEFYSR